MRLHEALGPPYTKKSDFFNERILINGRRRLSKHAPRHLPPIFFFNRARFRRERADLVPFIWVLIGRHQQLLLLFSQPHQIDMNTP